MATTVRGECVQGSGQPNYALLKFDDGSLITQADIASITWTLFNADSDPPTADPGYEDETALVSQVIFDELQTHPLNGRPYNFKHVLPAAALSAPNNWRIEYLVTPNDGEPFIAIFLLSTTRTYTD